MTTTHDQTASSPSSGALAEDLSDLWVQRHHLACKENQPQPVYAGRSRVTR